MSRAIPETLRYTETPLAVPSSSNERLFVPNNGSIFSYKNAGTTRIDIASQDFWDTSNSYLRFSVVSTNTTTGGFGAATCSFVPDKGVPMIKSLSIYSGSTRLERIDQYGKLYGFLQQAECPGGKLKSEASIMQNDNTTIMSTMTPRTDGEMLQVDEDGQNYLWTGSSTTAQVYGTRNRRGGLESPDSNDIPIDTPQVYCVPLVSALLNTDKYLPLMLLANPITIEIEWQAPELTGLWVVPRENPGTQYQRAQTVNPEDASGNSYEIRNVSMACHMVSCDPSVTNMLQQTLGENGSITLHGLGYSAYENTFDNLTSPVTLNIPARKKSITAAFTLLRYQATGAGATRTFTTTVGKQMGVTSYSYKVGSLDYPQRPVDCGDGTGALTGGGGDVTPAYCQLAKCFSRLGSTGDHSALSRVSFCQTNSATNPSAGDFLKMFVMGYCFSSFSPKAIIESGIDNATQSVPLSVELTRNTGGLAAGNIVATTFIQNDLFFHIDGQGLILPSE